MPEMIILIIMGVLLLVWVIFCGVQIFRRSRIAFAESDTVIHVKCEKCGALYDVSTDDFNSSYTSKYKSITKSRRAGIAIVNKPQFTYYAKKLYCPHCKQKKYAQVLNINEIQDLAISSVLKGASKWFVVMIIGGILWLAVMSFSSEIVSRYNEQKVNDMKQERYEDLKSRYHFGD